MKIRAIALCLAAIVVALATHIDPTPASVASGAPAPESLSAEAVQTAASAAELARLISVFEARVKEHTDELEYSRPGARALSRRPGRSCLDGTAAVRDT